MARRFPRFGWMIIAAVLAGTSAPPAWAQGKSGVSADLTLAEAVKLALERHPVLRAASHQGAAAAAGVD